MKTRLIFVRHAEAFGNVNRVFHGWTDSEITQKGHLQALKVAERLKDVKIDVIYSSSLRRSLQTAGYIAEIKSLPIIRTDKLKEINGGRWEGEDWAKLPEKWPYEYDTWENKPHMHKMPGGESMEELQERLITEIKYIIDNNKGKNICIVTHGTAIKSLMCFFHNCELDEMLDIPWYDNTSLTIIDYKEGITGRNEGIFEIIKSGDTSHLGKELSTIENQEWWGEWKSSAGRNNLSSNNPGSNNPDENNPDCNNDKLVSWLFETKAVRVCPEDKPFWYTSGTLGPYYINTHFLFGSEEKAVELLNIIDREKANILAGPMRILNITGVNYCRDPIYKGVIDKIIAMIKDRINLDEIDCISGGERRDWFFSMIVANMLDKPHITIFKNLVAVYSYKEIYEEVNDLAGKKILHIADLITEASSYERQWIPAISRRNGRIKWSVVVVDRKQGGEEYLASEGIDSYALVAIDINFFKKAMDMRLINPEQYLMIMEYIDDPKGSMSKFLKNHPVFLHDAFNSDEKTRERARLCVNKNIYGCTDYK